MPGSVEAGKIAHGAGREADPQGGGVQGDVGNDGGVGLVKQGFDGGDRRGALDQAFHFPGEQFAGTGKGIGGPHDDGDPVPLPGNTLLEAFPDEKSAVAEQGSLAAADGTDQGGIVGHCQFDGPEIDGVIQHDRHTGGGRRLDGRVRRVNRRSIWAEAVPTPAARTRAAEQDQLSISMILFTVNLLHEGHLPDLALGAGQKSWKIYTRSDLTAGVVPAARRIRGSPP